ncbi:ISxac3 transposase [Salinisphaera shabanensis T35B1]
MSAVGHCGDNAAEGLVNMRKRVSVDRQRHQTLTVAQTNLFD